MSTNGKQKKAPIDFQALLDEVNADFPVYQALDQDGNVVNKDLVPDLSDDELVELMTHMVWSRVLDQRSTALNRQGRLGFLHQLLDKRQVSWLVLYAFDKRCSSSRLSGCTSTSKTWFTFISSFYGPEDMLQVILIRKN